MKRISADTKVSIVAGFQEYEDGFILNTVALVAPKRETFFYRKCHLDGDEEKAHFTPSALAPTIFKLGGMNVGMLICYDVKFAEMVRGLAIVGADLIIVPTALPAGSASARISKYVVPVRAQENHVFLAYADLCGKERETNYQGGSVLVGPDGEDIVPTVLKPAMLLAQVRSDAIMRTKSENIYSAERLPAIYSQFQYL